jgi:hypothetical protein
MTKASINKVAIKAAKVLLWTAISIVISVFLLFVYVGLNANHLNE